MTPFDGTALLVMLLTFYPAVSPAALAQARRERPEYFAGGVIIGTSQEAIRLPDGRIFDLIENAGGAPGTTRWHVLLMVPGGDDPSFPLEPGPLTPIDEGALVTPAPAAVFEGLAAGALEQLGGADGVIGSAEQTLSETANNAVLHDGGGQELEDVDAAVAEIFASRSADEFADVVEQADGIGRELDATDADFDEAPPDVPMPNEPDTPPWPTDGTVPREPDPSEPIPH
jgi:hypothetical protein